MNTRITFAGMLLMIFAASAVMAELEPTEKQKAKFPEPEGAVKLSKTHDVWLDLKNKKVIADGVVCLREGQLEMFACPAGTKEHESVISLRTLARDVHAALLRIGARTGGPVQFSPKYIPASGDEVIITLNWRDPEGKQKTARGQSWVRHLKTQKEMDYKWVFAGSGFWTDPKDGKQYYHADGGDFVCVSNFPTATLDVPVVSSQANDDLLFEAFTEHIPARGTQVRVEFSIKPREKPMPVQQEPFKPGDGEVKDPFE